MSPLQVLGIGRKITRAKIFSSSYGCDEGGLNSAALPRKMLLKTRLSLKDVLKTKLPGANFANPVLRGENVSSANEGLTGDF